MEEKLAEMEGSEFDRAIERLDHFKSIQQDSAHGNCTKPRCIAADGSTASPD